MGSISWGRSDGDCRTDIDAIDGGCAFPASGFGAAERGALECALMLALMLRRALLVVPTFVGVTLLAFALIHLIPGDPVENLSGERGMDPEHRARLLHEFGLDKPFPLQYVEYVGQVLKGDLGTSLTTHEPVLTEFLTLFPATVELAFFAM